MKQPEQRVRIKWPYPLTLLEALSVGLQRTCPFSSRESLAQFLGKCRTFLKDCDHKTNFLMEQSLNNDIRILRKIV